MTRGDPPGRPPRIVVDADACPVKGEVYRVAKRYGLDVLLVAASWIRVPDDERVRLIVVNDALKLDAADDRIVEEIGSGDIAVTDDVHLAARCLEEGARVISPRGRVFSTDSIGGAVSTRDFLARLREAGVETSGPAPFRKADRSEFLQRLDETVQAIRRGA